MKNAWKLFEYKDTPIYLKYWFFAILLFVPVSWVVSIFIGILIHEIAHTKKANKLGYKTDYIFIDIFHGGALIDSRYTDNNKHSMSIAFAGPLSNLMLSLGSFLIATLFVSFDSVNINSPVTIFLSEFTVVNLLLFALNLIPIYPLDGGRISKSLFRMLFGKDKGRIVNGVLSLTLSLSVFIYSVYMIDVVLIIFSIIFIIASFSELKLKEEDEKSIN